MKQPKMSVSEKMQKEQPEFVSEVEGLSIQDLDNRLATLAKGLEEVTDSQEADEDLEEKREAARQAAAGYLDAKKALRLKSRYIIALIKEKGGK